VFRSSVGANNKIATAGAAGSNLPWGFAGLWKTSSAISDLETEFGSGGTTQAAVAYSGVGNLPYTFSGTPATRWGAVLATNTNYIDITTYSSNNSQTRINGSSTAALFSGLVGEAGQAIGIGQFNGSWAGSNLTYGEVFFFNRDLTTTEKEQIEGYFAHKFSQTALLASSHPYKSSPP